MAWPTRDAEDAGAVTRHQHPTATPAGHSRDRPPRPAPHTPTRDSGVGLEYGSSTNSADASKNGGDILAESGARLTVASSAVNLGSSAGLGGGIYSEGTLTVINSQLRHDNANLGGAIASAGTSTVTITGSLMSNNSTSAPVTGGLGGAVSISTNQRLNATGSTFQHNSVTQAGVSTNPGAITFTRIGAILSARLFASPGMAAVCAAVIAPAVARRPPVPLMNSSVPAGRTLPMALRATWIGSRMCAS